MQKDLASLGYALEGYKLLPGIQILELDESKKAPSIAVDEASKSNKIQNDLSTNSIPQSDEKYTENLSVESIAKQGYTLMITVDCGISAIDEIEFANKLGLV